MFAILKLKVLLTALFVNACLNQPVYLLVCPGESLPKFHHRLAAGPRGEGRAIVRHPGPHQLGCVQPPQDHQRGETEGGGQAAAKQLQGGQVGFCQRQMVREFFLHSFLRATCVFGARSEVLRQCQAATAEQRERYEATHMGGFKRIYPREGGEKYDKYFKHCSSLFQETAASKAREECTRYALSTPSTQSSEEQMF